MALYLNGNKLKVNSNGHALNFLLHTAIQALNYIALKSSDDYVLKSSNNFILTAKGEK